MHNDKQSLSYICYFLVAIISMIFTGVTSIVLIYYGVPDYIYLNIIGVFLFTVYNKFLPSILYILIYQFILYKFGQVYEFVSYTLVIGIVDVAIISAITSIGFFNKIKYLNIWISALFLSVFSKITSILIYRHFIEKTEINMVYLLGNSDFIIEIKRYFFSALITCLLCFFVDVLNTYIIKNWRM